AQRVIGADVELVLRGDSQRGCAKVVAGAGKVGERIKRQQVFGDGVDALRGNRVAGEGLPRAGGGVEGIGIENFAAQIRKIASSFDRGGNGAYHRLRLVDAQPLVVAEEEQLVFANWPAQRKAELVLTEHRFAGVEELAG